MRTDTRPLSSSVILCVAFDGLELPSKERAKEASFSGFLSSSRTKSLTKPSRLALDEGARAGEMSIGLELTGGWDAVLERAACSVVVGSLASGASAELVLAWFVLDTRFKSRLCRVLGLAGGVESLIESSTPVNSICASTALANAHNKVCC